MNCWNTLKPAPHNVDRKVERDGSKSARMLQWAISSQAASREVEGSTTRAWNLGDEMVKPHERGTSQVDEDIVWTVGKPTANTSLTDTANAAADVVGSCFVPAGPRNGDYATFGNAIKRLPRFETQRFAKARATDLVLTMRMGVGELLEDGYEITTDA